MTGVIRPDRVSGHSLPTGRRTSVIFEGRANGIRRFSVDDETCIGCRLCHERAPENFDVPPGELSSRVTKQPGDRDEEVACLEAEEYCPTGGIHHDPGD